MSGVWTRKILSKNNVRALQKVWHTRRPQNSIRLGAKVNLSFAIPVDVMHLPSATRTLLAGPTTRRPSVFTKGRCTKECVAPMSTKALALTLCNVLASVEATAAPQSGSPDLYRQVRGRHTYCSHVTRHRPWRGLRGAPNGADAHNL